MQNTQCHMGISLTVDISEHAVLTSLISFRGCTSRIIFSRKHVAVYNACVLVFAFLALPLICP